MKTKLIFGLLLVLTACGVERAPEQETCGELPPIYPDYAGVTIPAEIAPMNFNIVDVDDYDRMYVKVTGSKGGNIEAGGDWAAFDQKQWRKITEQNRGGSLSFDVSVKKKDGSWQRYQPFEMHVSEHPLNDYGLVYRKIAPGFETFSKIGIYQRQLSSFDESPILEETAVNGQCLNCHYSNRGNANQFSIHIRGSHGGTYVRNDRGDAYLNTKTDETVGSCTYGYWHPEGRYCAYSLNRIFQNFYVGQDKIIEPWDAMSDLAVLDTHTNQLILSPLLTTDNCETTPAFSADGSTLYFCKAPKMDMPGDYEKLKYSLCSIGFDAANGKYGEKIDTVICADSIGKSVSLPRPSYDGRLLMYCLTDYGTTPINRQESDLYVMNLATGEHRLMVEINSEETDAYHNWAHDSRWFVFGSKREDHLYSLLYLSCIGDDGVATKPFLLPQYNPEKYYGESLYSFNAPDFTEKVSLDARAVRDMVMNNPTQKVSVKR